MNRILMICLITLAITVPKLASAYLVAYCVPLEELAGEHSDFIFKGTVVSTAPVEDESFKKFDGFQSYETVFRVVSVVKGNIDAKQIRFRHYGENQEELIGRMFMPQHYQFEVGRCYIVCAKQTGVSEQLRQIWDYHRTKVDQGVLRAASDQPHVGKILSDVYWNELSGLLSSEDADDAIYAINQLNLMTGIGYNSHKSIDREKAVAEIVRLVDSQNDELAIKAIQSIGLENPQLGGSLSALIALNPTHFPGHSTPPEQKPNPAAQRYRETLVRIAESNSSGERRSAAIASLGLSMNPDLLPLAKIWITDDAPDVRSAATILLAEYKGEVAKETWESILADEVEAVRRSGIRAIGIGQVTDMLSELTELLDDPNPQIVSDAAASLLSFPLEKSRQILQSKTDHPEYGCLFINALAAEDTAAYEDQLGEIIRAAPNPKGWWGGHVTWGIAWNLLFKHVQQQPAASLRSGDFDSELDSLESPVTEREKSNHYSSSEPRDLYALYAQRGMHTRAKNYRKSVNEKTSYDMEIYFDRVDDRPNDFQRR